MAYRPPVWRYEPMSIRRQRELARFDSMRDEISPLVANGDPLSLLKAAQRVRAAAISDEEKQKRQRGFLHKIGEAVRAKIAEMEQVNQGMVGAPPEVQMAADRESATRRIARNGPVPGVPLGVADAFPEKLTPETRRYGQPGRLEEPGQAVQKAGEILDTPGRIVRGVAAGLGPSDRPLMDIPGNIRKAVTDPTSFRGVDTGAISKLPDSGPEAGPFHITPKTVAGFGIDTITDPLNLVGTGKADDIIRGGAKGARRTAVGYRDLTHGIPVGASIKDVTGRTWYHGTGTGGLTAESLDPLVAKASGLFGHGIYFTDRLDTASSYAVRRGKDTAPVVYQATFGPMKILDAESKASGDVLNAVMEAAGGYEDVAGELERKIRPGMTVEEAWKALQSELRDQGFTRDDASEVLAGLNASLRDLGYDAISYTGGVRTNSPQHQALMLLDPNSVMSSQRPSPIQSFEQSADDVFRSRVREAVQAKFKPADRIKLLEQGEPVGGGGASRTGNRLLQLPDSKQLQAELGRPPTLKDIFNVDRMGRREATAQANRLRSEAVEDFRTLGKTTKDAKGNILVKGIAPDQKDIARGQEWAPLVKVLEKPQAYNLTPEQAQAASRLARIPELVKTEREAFGVGPRVLDVDPDEQFIWRKAKTDSKGTPSNKPRPSVGGTRLGGGADRMRVFEDIDDALDAGVVYAHPQEAFDQNVMSGLKKTVDEHVKQMLVPMSDSAAERVSPGLRARNEYLQQRLTSLKGTLGRLDGRTNSIVDAYIHSANPDLDALYDELQQVKVGLNAVGKAGPNFGKASPQVQAELKQVMSDIRQLRPAWRREIRRARAVPAGRSTVPMDVAPALAGRDFEPRVAQQIEDFYRRTARIRIPKTDKSISLRADIPAVRGVSAVLTPIRATGDLSAIMINQVTTAARHPVTFTKNVALSARDLVADGPYQRWLASGETDDAARHGVAIVGEAGEPLEFQFSNWMQHVHGIKQLNEHYVRLNNRQRVDLYNMEVAARGGPQNVDDAVKEGIARAINRFTGVSNARATDAETIASFAPNFTRAHIETIASALSDGTVEGSLARQYLATMLLAGSGLVAGVAYAQGRDPREVLTPLDMDALKDKKLRLNSNFMTVRAFGQDVKVFGKYDSLLRLLAITGDAAFRSLDEQDAMQLFDAVGYASGSQGSPAASFLTSLIKGQTFEGDAPLSLRGLASNVIPFTGPEVVGSVASAVGNVAQGDFGQAATDLGAATVNFTGGKASPVTPKERLDIETQKRFGVDYKDTDKDQRNEIRSAFPDLVDEYEGGARGKTREALEVKREYRTRQESRDQQLLSGNITREQWMNAYYDDLTAKRAKLEVIYGDDPITKPKNPLERYIQILQQATDLQTGILDRDKVDAGMATLTASDQEYIDGHVGMDDTPIAGIFREVRKVRRERAELPKYRGFTAEQAEDIDEVWQEVRNNARSADRLDMLRALRFYMASNPGLDPMTIRGVRRRINGRLRQLPVRQRFDRIHPEVKVFYGSGRLTQAEAAYLQDQMQEAAA